MLCKGLVYFALVYDGVDAVGVGFWVVVDLTNLMVRKQHRLRLKYLREQIINTNQRE